MLRAASLAVLLAGLAACGGDPEPGAPAPGAEEALAPEAAAAPRDGPPHAQWETVDALRADRTAVRHASDGGGRAWLEELDGRPPVAVAGTPGRFAIVYEVGPLGVARGGAIHLQLPFWYWSTPQAEAPELTGYTTVELLGGGEAGLEVETLDDQLLGIRAAARALEPGERLRIVYGAGEAGAVADRFAERGSRFWIAVDGDGDGVRAFLAGSPGVDVLPGPAAQLRATLPGVARPGEEVDLVLAALDSAGSAGAPFEGEIALRAEPEWPGLPARVSLGPGGHTRVRAAAPASGIVRVVAEAGEGLAPAESNPMLVDPNGPRILWGDLHGHSNLSDGTGVPEDYFLYARDVAGLDVAALTDHDHWGVLDLDEHPEMWDEIREWTRRFHEPGRFVTLLGYEWTNWIYGHRHVLYFGDDGPLLSWMDPDHETPTQLWAGLEGRPALTFAHHSAGGPVPVDWSFAPDPRFEPVTEIVSVHGSSEALDSPLPIYSAVPGNFARDALDRGHRLGFIGSGDSHDGHPGLAQLASPSSGLAAILAEERTREAVLAALRERRCYATNGPRILLRAALGAHGMGARVPAPQGGSESLYVRVIAQAPLERLDLVRSGRPVERVPLEGRLEAELQTAVEDLAAGEYLYVRAVQQDGGAAWSSPFFLE